MQSYPEVSNSSVEHRETSQLSNGFRPNFEGINQWMNQTVKAIARTLLGSSDPFIWQQIDRHGNTWWIIDDSLTGSRFYAVSEEEVRAWIEQHYYAQPQSLGRTSRPVNSLRVERW